MRHLTAEEIEIMKKMDELDENSPEYKKLQEELIKIDEQITGETEILY